MSGDLGKGVKFSRCDRLMYALDPMPHTVVRPGRPSGSRQLHQHGNHIRPVGMPTPVVLSMVPREGRPCQASRNGLGYLRPAVFHLFYLRHQGRIGRGPLGKWSSRFLLTFRDSAKFFFVSKGSRLCHSSFGTPMTTPTLK